MVLQVAYKLATYLKREIFASLVVFSQVFIFANLSFIKVLYILILLWDFVVVCSSASSMWVTELLTKFFDIWNIEIFDIWRYLDIKNLILDWLHRRRSKGADILKRFTFFFLCFLSFTSWYPVKYFWDEYFSPTIQN